MVEGTAVSAPDRIDPRKVMQRRRRLHFGSFDEILAEGTRLTELVNGGNSEREDLAGPDARVVHLANMPLGQALGHLGRTLELSSREISFSFPLHMRLMARMFKGTMLRGGMAMPFEQPRELNLEITPGFEMTSAQGLDELHKAINHFRRAPYYKPNLLLGDLSAQEWEQLSCRHAEWHLGFMHDRPAG